MLQENYSFNTNLEKLDIENKGFKLTLLEAQQLNKNTRNLNKWLNDQLEVNLTEVLNGVRYRECMGRHLIWFCYRWNCLWWKPTFTEYPDNIFHCQKL